MQLQKEVKSNPKQPSKCAALNCEKDQGGGQEMAMMVGQ